MSRPVESTLDELLAYEVPKIAKSLARRFQTLEGEDIQQQCWVGVLEHKAELGVTLEAKGPEFMAKDARDYAAKAVRALRREQDRHVRARAALAGYNPEDEVFYSAGLLRALLPAYLDNGVCPDPPQGRELNGGTGNTDPATRGDWLAMMLDVDMAYNRLRKPRQALLRRYFSYPQGSGGWTHLEIASALGIHPVALKRRVDSALRDMQYRLGGESPWR